MTLEKNGARHLPRPTAKPAHPARLAPNLAAAWRGVKCTACLMGCLFCLLAAMMFYGAMIEGLSSWSASLALCGLCIWMCQALYRLAEGEERHQRRMQGRARRRAGRQKRRMDTAKRITKWLDSIRNARF